MPGIESSIVEVLCFRKRARSIQILALKRSDNERIYPGLWQIVSGKIKGRESALAAALRECKEETGLVPKDLWTLPLINGFLVPSTDTIHFHPIFAAEIDDGVEPVLSAEHQAYRWVSARSAQKTFVWPGTHRAIDVLVEHVLRVPELRDRVRVDTKRVSVRKER